MRFAKIEYKVGRKVEDSSCLSCAYFLIVEKCVRGVVPVIGLLLNGGEFRVLRRIISIVVNAFNRKVRRDTLSPKRDESLGVVFPFCAQFYSASSVTWECWFARIVASASNSHPSTIGDGSRKPVANVPFFVQLIFLHPQLLIWLFLRREERTCFVVPQMHRQTHLVSLG